MVRPLFVGAALLGLLLSFSAWGASFPKPDPEREFSELKVASGGSPLRMPIEDWEGARRRVTESKAWRAWLKGERDAVEDWMARRHDRVEWVAGWWHDFVSPKDGSFLTWTPEEPGEWTLSSPSDPRVQLTPKLHAAWVYGFRSRNVGKIVTASLLFKLTGEARFGEWAASQIDFYATNYARWPVPNPGRKAHLMWQSLDEAVCLSQFAEAARLLGEYAAADRRQRWFDLLFKPEVELLEQSLQRVHNIACWHRAAEAQVAILYNHEDFWRRAVDGKFGLRRQVADGITSDYFWFEQSMGYNNYVVSALLPLFKFAALSGRADRLRQEMACVQNLMLAPISIRFPTGQLPNPADSGRMGHAPNTSLLAAAYPVFPTTLGCATAAGQRNWTTLLDPPPEVRVKPLPPPLSRDMESSRMAFLQRGPWSVFFHYGQLDASHAQSEALHFEAFFQKTDVTHDPGTVGYGSPLYREYYTRGLAHNVPLVDGEGQEGWHPGQSLSFDAARGIMAARQPRYRKDAAAERELKVDGAALIDTVRLQLNQPVPRRLGLALQLQGKVQLMDGFVPAVGLTESNRPAAFAYWKQPRSATFEDRAVFAVQFPERRMRVTFELPGRFTVLHGSVPDAPPGRRDALYIETTGTNVVFRTRIEPAE